MAQFHHESDLLSKIQSRIFQQNTRLNTRLPYLLDVFLFSGYTLKKLLGLWMNGFTAFSEKPLRLATYVGVVNIFIALLCSIILIIQFAMGILLNYSLFIAINVVLFLTGELMFFVGLLGEYIGRMYICINNAPQYVIKEKINIENKEEE